MQRDEDVRHLLDFLDRVIGFGQIDMHPGSNGRPGCRKIFIVAAKTRYDCFAIGGVDGHRLSADGVSG